MGYAVFGSNGRVSYPWCLPGSEAVREPLLDAVLAEMTKRGLPQAWAAYRGDWSPVLDFLRQHDFTEIRTMINYVADLSRLPSQNPLPSNRLVARLEPEDLPQLIALAPDLFRDVDARQLEQFYWHHPFYNFPESLFAWKDGGSGEILGVYLLVVSDRFADPTKIDAAMPCFRLGAFGTERERHKRVNGLFSCVFADEAEGKLLLTAWADSQASPVRTDPRRGPGPLRRGLALCLLRPFLPAPGLVPDLVAAIIELKTIQDLGFRACQRPKAAL